MHFANGGDVEENFRDGLMISIKKCKIEIYVRHLKRYFSFSHIDVKYASLSNSTS